MSVSFGCRCPERRKPVGQRRWVVIARRCNYSAFNGCHYTPSDWSEIYCLTCGALGRTKAAYVAGLLDAKPDLSEMTGPTTHCRDCGQKKGGGHACLRSISFDPASGSQITKVRKL